MSFAVPLNQPICPTGKTAPNSCDVQPTLSNPPQHRLDLGPPQRRRVNPESLAARLGPELVAEMEKHIIPGSIEMPPFSVRRDIQVKFGIDRRHIYDFFHSRGLRCLSEKAMRNGYLETKSERPARSIAPSSAFPEPRKRRAAAVASDTTSLRRTHAPRKQKGRQKRLQRQPSSSPTGLDDDSAHPCEAPFLLEPELDVDSRMADMIQESPPSLDGPFFMSDVSCTSLLGHFLPFSSEEKESESAQDVSPCYSISSLIDLSPSTSTSTLSTSSSTLSMSTISSVCEVPDLRPRILPLSSQERKAHYAWLDRIIGPASGIQESVGTYRAFMEHQREVYYDRLVMVEQPRKVAVPRRATNELICWPDVRTTRPTIALSASGPSLPGRTDTDTCRHLRMQGAVSLPSSRLSCPIPDWTRPSRRRSFSATVDM